MKRAILWLVVLAGCSGAADSAKAPNAEETDGAADTALDVGALRVDVFPPDGLGLLPQSHELRGGAVEGATFELFPTVTWSGTLEGQVTRGWSGAAEVPYTVEPLAATFTASVNGTRLGGSVQSDAAGRFELPLPAYDEPYDLSIVPLDADLAPFHEEERLFEDDTREDILLPVGLPVYGRVADSSGRGISHVPMRIVRTDLDVEVASATFETDESGWYVTRVEGTGAYAVEVLGGLTERDDPEVVPALRTEVLVEDPENGAALNIDLGTLESASARGYVYDADGEEVRDAVVRFTAEALDGATGELVIETQANSDGYFGLDLLPGTYTIEVIPPYSPVSTPRVYVDEVIEAGSNDLGTRRVDGSATLAGTVVDAPEGSLVVATQVGYGNVYSAKTSGDGRFSMEVPAGEYVVRVTPADGDAGAMTYRQLATGDDARFELDPGEPLSGAVTFEGEAVAYALYEVYDVASGVLVAQGRTDESGGFAVLVPQVEADTGE
ncbi:MAG: hypothetical protein ACOZNI_20765 [Myxococcota bacterium]